MAFVTTTEGETFYGELQSFQTGANPAGIATAATQQPVETARYDVRGRRLSAPAQGLNIVRMSDGTVRKVFVK